ncbi:hypothetical protein E0Z10_g6431 [Xylaria hypoxylon]|uniref:Uncharacterized protein n=1 Tax=Xylaria hypoxylon TaxID=37992 RepID=A0A4Z0YT84_9PEZI|nr:hypothetical protein E0Z10_g6431 [Xylaria hypoxylon]
MADNGYNYGNAAGGTRRYTATSVAAGYAAIDPTAGYTCNGVAGGYAAIGDTEYPTTEATGYTPTGYPGYPATGETGYTPTGYPPTGYPATGATGYADTAAMGGYTTTATTGYADTAAMGGYTNTAAPGPRQPSQRYRLPQSAEDRIFEQEPVASPKFWKGDKAELAWKYVYSGPHSTTGGDAVLAEERERNIKMEERRVRGDYGDGDPGSSGRNHARDHSQQRHYSQKRHGYYKSKENHKSDNHYHNSDNYHKSGKHEGRDSPERHNRRHH